MASTTPGKQQQPPPQPPTPFQAQQQLAAQAAASQMLDAKTLQAILQSFHQKKTYPKPDKPRVGNVNQHGAWTGLGASKEGSIPRTKDCMRSMIMEESKAYTQLTYIETECRKGLQDQPGPLFCMEDEPDAKLIVTTLQNLQELIELKGMEGVFNIVQRDGSTLNMLNKPGALTEQMVDEWVEDLRKNGVHDGKGGRLQVCKYDEINLDWSFDAIRNSQSTSLASHIKHNVPPKDHNGPKLFFHITQIVPGPPEQRNKGGPFLQASTTSNASPRS